MEGFAKYQMIAASVAMPSMAAVIRRIWFLCFLWDGLGVLEDLFRVGNGGVGGGGEIVAVLLLGVANSGGTPLPPCWCVSDRGGMLLLPFPSGVSVFWVVWAAGMLAVAV